jgi:hypothetical protein
MDTAAWLVAAACDQCYVQMGQEFYYHFGETLSVLQRCRNLSLKHKVLYSICSSCLDVANAGPHTVDNIHLIVQYINIHEVK